MSASPTTIPKTANLTPLPFFAIGQFVGTLPIFSIAVNYRHCFLLFALLSTFGIALLFIAAPFLLSPCFTAHWLLARNWKRPCPGEIIAQSRVLQVSPDFVNRQFEGTLSIFGNAANF